MKAELNGQLTNVLLDSGAGVSIIDERSLKRLKGSATRSNLDENLIDASGNKMDIVGKVCIKVLIKGSRQPVLHEFRVVNTNMCTNILLGRDFLKRFGSVTFDFETNRVKLGKMWFSGLELTTPQRVRLPEKVTIPARTEQTVAVKCSPKTAFLVGDFEPTPIDGITGTYGTYARVIPNAEGVFKIAIVNVNSDDVELPSRKTIGFLNPAGSDVFITSGPDTTTRASTSPAPPQQYQTGAQLSAEEKDRLSSLIHSYEDIFANNPKSPRRNTVLEHKIITDNSLPVYQKPRRIPAAWEQEVDAQVHEMLDNNIIRPSESPWNSPIILVKKKDNSTRFVCDFRKLNDTTKKDTYPLPHIKDVLDKMAGAKYWSTLDAASAYWSMPLHEQDKEKTAFSVPRGKFEFNVTPYGLCNAGASYQRLMDICLSGLPADHILAYMDDIAIYSKTFDEHLKDLEAVLLRLRSAGISLKASKCIFASQTVEFLGYELSAEGIKPQERLTSAIREFPRPSTKKDLKRFLGLAGFYRNFIEGFARISKPLNKITSDNVAFEWTDHCEEAFENLKERLCSKPVLSFPRCGEPFVVEVDASDIAVGGVLSQQQQDGTTHPVAFFSVTLNASQQRWSTHSKEAYALLLAVRTWHVYLAGTEFILNSDHNPLVHIRNTKDPRGKFARWISELEEYNYTIQYLPGKLNTKADALSRFSSKLQNQDVDQFEDLFEEKIYAIDAQTQSFKAQIMKEQDDDPVIGPAKRLVANGDTVKEGRLKRVSNQLRIEDDILTKSGRPVLPAPLRRVVVTKYHEQAHFGTDKTHAIISARYYWPNMYAYIKRHVSTCSVCERAKCDPHAPKAPLLPLFIPDAPMQFISIDLATLPQDDSGYKYILLMGDVFSKYIEAEPLQNQSALEVVNALFHSWILKHGCPSYLLSDQGSNVDGQTIKELCEMFAIEKRRSSAYHSQGNGFAERNIRNVREVFRTSLLDRGIQQKHWRSLLNEIVFALNTSESSATKRTPYEVIFGRKPVLPQDLLFEQNVHPADTDVVTPAEYAAELKTHLSEVYQNVAHNLGLNREQMQKQYNKNIRFHDYHIGEKVWLKTKYYKTGENKKLSPRRNGPWTIVEKLPNGLNFRIENDSTRNRKVVHHNRLTPSRSHAAQDSHDDGDKSAPTIPTKTWNKPDRGHPARGNGPTQIVAEDTFSSSDESEPEDNVPENNRRYPLRERRQRVVEGGIPWNAIRD